MIGFIRRSLIKVHLNGPMPGELLERQISYLFAKFINAGDVVIDGGASYGRHTILLSKLVGESGCVHAIEALPEMCSLLKVHNLGNVLIHNQAISNYQGEASFVFVDGNSGYSGLRERKDIPGTHLNKRIEVSITSLDSLLDHHLSRVNLIKLDLEGGEFHALRGSEHILLESRPIVIFENGLGESAKLYAYSENDFFDYFKKIKYRIVDFFGETVENFGDGSSRQQVWQFVAIPAEMRTSKVKRRILVSLLQALTSVRMQVPLETLNKRL